MRSSAMTKGNRAMFLPRITEDSISSPPAGGKEPHGFSLVPHCSGSAPMPELNLDETLRVRTVFFEHVRDEFISNTFDLRVVLAELGLYPTEEELLLLLDAYERKLNVTQLCHYLRFYKRECQLAELARRRFAREGGRGNAVSLEERDDTLRAFVALGGREGGGGTVALADLRRVCRAFGLAVDVDAMARDASGDAEGRDVDFAAFTALWRSAAESVTARLGSDDGHSTHPEPITTTNASAVLGTRRRSATRELSDAYKFPQIPGASAHTVANSNSTYINTPGSYNNNNYNLMFEEEHLQALRQYLYPEKSDGGIDAGTSNAVSVSGIVIGASNVRRKQGRNLSTQQLPYNVPQGEVELRRSMLGMRDEVGAAATGGAGGADDDGKLPATVGGFRAPSPMILSVRNSAAYKRRMMAFTQRTRTRAKPNRNQNVWSRTASVAPEDDVGRS